MCNGEIKNDVRSLGSQMCIERCDEKAPIVAELAWKVGWSKLWDEALTVGWKHNYPWPTAADQTNEWPW